MDDTSPLMKKYFGELIMQRSSEERLKMSCSMFDAAKQIVKASILAEYPQITEQEMKRTILLRYYGNELKEFFKDSILSEINRERGETI